MKSRSNSQPMPGLSERWRWPSRMSKSAFDAFLLLVAVTVVAGESNNDLTERMKADRLDGLMRVLGDNPGYPVQNLTSHERTELRGLINALSARLSAVPQD